MKNSTCPRCSNLPPDSIIHVSSFDDPRCVECGESVSIAQSSNPLVSKSESLWDQYFYNICNAVGSKSRCHSRQIGAVLVRDNSIIATGYNGPARGVPHCGSERMKVDGYLRQKVGFISDQNMCPRKALGYASGEGINLCTAAHAEQNCIANAARMGVEVKGATLYMNDQIPCKVCLVVLINAGVHKIVVTKLEHYSEEGKVGELIVNNTYLKDNIREYIL